MPSAPPSNNAVQASGATNGGGGGGVGGEGTTADSSKFRRFLKRFGRHPSDEGLTEHDASNNSSSLQPTAAEGGAPVPSSGVDDGKKSATTRSRRGSKTKQKRSDSLLSGRFFSSSSNSNSAPPLPRSGSATKHTPVSTPGGGVSTLGAGFEGTKVKGLANTLTLPSDNSSPPPQIRGLPHHDPIATVDLMHLSSSQPQTVGAATTSNISSSTPASLPVQDAGTRNPNGVSVHNGQSHEAALTNGDVVESTSQTGTDNSVTQAGYNGSHHILSAQSSNDSSRSGMAPSFDSESAVGRNRDSVDNRTMDTGKSRASTKPTTLMSMDTRENVPGTSYAPLAQIAQHRQGETTGLHNARVPSTGRSGVDGSSGTGTSVIHFASAPPMGRTASGTIVQLPGQGEAPEDIPFANVPTLSRPHPSNNPHPSGIPADNASMLTLASSTAAASIGGGAASSRGHSHAAPSLGGARSIGGSFMGDRRNSSDTYASVKALPPLSRRGSDSSSRTGMSIAASATGRSSAQAAMASAGAGPGAPGDRISIHRTPSQKTIATQLSIPLSTSNVATSHVDQAGGASTSDLLSAPTAATAVPASHTSFPSGESEPVETSESVETGASAAAGATNMEVPSITTTQPSPNERSIDDESSSKVNETS